jgi:hypothetical protein
VQPGYDAEQVGRHQKNPQRADERQQHARTLREHCRDRRLERQHRALERALQRARIVAQPPCRQCAEQAERQHDAPGRDHRDADAERPEVEQQGFAASHQRRSRTNR